MKDIKYKCMVNGKPVGIFDTAEEAWKYFHRNYNHGTGYQIGSYIVEPDIQEQSQ